ncbi:fimbria major subunit [Parabacteroides goldsteinii]|uniref:fimbria major subunit n=1 Tax=Parabacteroides goldsteinii TaxID=328812 RepID=UPI003AB24AF8
MKLKHYSLWALAFAIAAVSCSDDLDNPNKGNENPDGNGSSTYMKVTVNTGVVTRSDPSSSLPPTGGETGDGNEEGLVNEYIVRNVTVILYKNVSGDTNMTKTDSEFRQDSEIVGVGYAATSGAMGSGDDEWHSKSATVLVTARDDEDFDGNTYGVIAVTNWPREDELKNKIKNDNLSPTQLANLLVETTHSVSDTGTKRNFIMSSHIKDGKTETVTLEANATPEAAPNATVHVERLAAKVRIKPTDVTSVTNYIYPINVESKETAKVRLDNVVLVNKLKTGSYLLKRVTSDINTGNDIPNLTDDSWLGDENEKSETVTEGLVYPGINYVIDPWTRAKTVNESGKIVTTPINAEGETPGKPTMMNKDASIPPLAYDNKYDGTKTFSELWTDLSNAKQLSAATPNTESILVDYTMENTTSVVASKNGYSTGALFQAVYLPKEWSAVNNDKSEVEAVSVNYEGGYNNIGQSTKGQTFYTYQGNIYKDFEAIFNEFVWEKQKPLKGTSETIYSYDNFKSSEMTKISMTEFANSYLYKNTATDPIGYISHLRTRIDASKNAENFNTMTFNGEDGIDKYVESPNQEIQKAVYANVKKYDNGITYYPYWIRHANNGKPTEMGIMEFGIVRNNIYDMTVKSISGLGLSGMEKPEPDKDDETKDYYFNVQINVKNWVIRNNSGIIL